MMGPPPPNNIDTHTHTRTHFFAIVLPTPPRSSTPALNCPCNELQWMGLLVWRHLRTLCIGGTSCSPSSPGNTFRMMFSMKHRGKNLLAASGLVALEPPPHPPLLHHPRTPLGPFVFLIIHYREVAFALKPVEVDEAWRWPTKHQRIQEPETCLCDRTPVIPPCSINFAPRLWTQINKSEGDIKPTRLCKC